MPVGPSTRLGPYECLSSLGAGGMGEVWKARDTRLDRLVAIKVLPDGLSGSADFLARFEREAKAVAALAHPNIVALHDIGRQDDVSYAVMELLEGESLRARLTQGPLPPKKAVDLAILIAHGLAAAHERGIVHRDLKPDNLWITREGRAKILDFGLARQSPVQPADGRSELATAAFPQRHDSTGAGTILGTVGYMSPEQVRGEAVDHRSDIFSFGVVLHEMLTGKRAFARNTPTETMAAILRDEPPDLESTASRPMPAGLARIVARCLEKNPDHRFRSAHDVAFVLENLSSSAPSVSALAEPWAVAGRARRWRQAALLAFALALGAVAGFRFTLVPAPPPPVVRLAVPLPEGDRYVDTNRRPLAISPDGTTIVYVALRDGRRLLHLRRMGERDPVVLAGTDGAAMPFFSPDGQWVGFFGNGTLKKVAIGGSGLETLVTNLGDARGGYWGADGRIVYTPNNMSGLFRVASSGGPPEAVTQLDAAAGEVSHRWPQVLPDGSILMNTWRGPGTDEHTIVVQSASGERQVLVSGGDSPVWLPSGKLLYGRLDRLYVVPWKPGGPPPSSAARELPEQPRIENEGASAFAASASGTLAYMGGSSKRYALRVVWVDRRGAVTPVPLPERNYQSVSLSPDGRKAAVQIEEGTIGIHLYDFERGTLSAFATSDGASQAPVFSSDGEWIYFRATRRGGRNIWRKRVDGTGHEEPLVEIQGRILSPTAVSSDGAVLLFTCGQSGIMAARLAGDPAPREVVGSPADEMVLSGQLSPDGRLLAYTRMVAGLGQVMVRKLDAPGTGRTVATGTEPRWSRDGQELLLDHDGRMWSVARVRGTDEFGPPRELFAGRFRPASNANAAWDVAPDGRFLRVQEVVPEPRLQQIDVVLGFDVEVEAATAQK